jgi:ribosomal protein S18 acetylase RimI-like enzyme
LLRQRNCVALVAEVTAGTGKRKVGVLMAEKIMRAVRICFLGVHPRYRRLGIGRRLLERLQESVCGSSVTRIFIYFREDQNELLSFFRACGFRARLRRDFYGEGEDAYEMSKAIGVKLPPTHCFHPRNRLIRRTNIDDLLRGRKRWFS